ncbi:MAG: carboxypeptidase regulatory-like domain-containing protein [Acidobacteriota bacterium]
MLRELTKRLACLTFVLMLPTLAAAQETTGSIAGTVTDTNGAAVPLANITISGDRGDRNVVTGEEGKFFLAFLTPGLYTITVDADGYSSLENYQVRVNLGQRSRVDLQLLPPMRETMTVSADREQLIDLSKQATGANILTEVAEQLPLGRNVQDLVFLAPSVKSGLGTGAANPSVSGSSGLENQYVFNGVNVTNAGYGALGSYSIVHGSQGQGINYSFVEETQVVTGGFKPEYGQATGGIINVLTKSGSNEWEGDVYGYYTPTGLQADFITPDVDPAAAPFEGIEETELGFGVGGPLIQDKLFFWVGGAHQVTTTTRRAPNDSFGLFDLGDISYDREITTYAGKLTIQPHQDHTIELSFFGDPSETDFGPLRGSSTLRQDDNRQFSKLDYGGKNWTVSYKGSPRPNFNIEASIGNANNEFEEFFVVDDHQIIERVATRLRDGGIGFFERNESDNTQFKINFTNLIGNHELKYGFGVEDIDYTAANDRTGPSFTNRYGDPTTTGAAVFVVREDEATLPNGGVGVVDRYDGRGGIYGDTVIDDDMDGMADAVIYNVIRGRLDNVEQTVTSDYKYAFIQDDWALTPNMTLSYGIRWEEINIKGTETTYKFPSEISPRLGLSWDHTGEGRSKLYGNIGRYYEKVPLDIAVRLFSPETGIRRGHYYDRDLTMAVPCNNPVDPSDPFMQCDRYQVSGGFSDSVVPGTTLPYVTAVALGYERTLGQDWKVKGEFQWRDQGTVLEDYADSPASDVEFGFDPDGNPASFGSYIVGNIDPNTVAFRDGVGFPDVEREYMALVLEAQKSTERWFFHGQYTLSALHGNYEGLFRNDNGQSDPNVTSLFDFPNEALFYHTFSNGKLNTDRTHRMQAYGAYKWRNGWSLSSRVLAQSGTPKLRLATLPPYANGGEIALDRRGARGRTPFQWNADVGVGKKWELNTRFESTISVNVDIFNFFNHRFVTGFDYDFDSGADTDICLDWLDPTAPGADETCDTREEAEQRLVDSIANGIPNPNFDKPTSYNAPREVRFGVKWTF